MENNRIKGNLLYGQGGGPTSVINTSAYGLFVEAFKHNEIEHVFAAKNGIVGILADDLYEVENNDYLKNLTSTPGAAFGSARVKLKSFEEDKDTYYKILEIFKKNNIRFFFFNGGNDSMDTIDKISNFFLKEGYDCRCIGINKTVDNDLMNTDFCLGFGSAAKFIANTVMEIALDDSSYKQGRINIIEVMGRHAGWLAAAGILPAAKGIKPDFIFVPEVPFDMDEVLPKIKKCYEEKKHCIIVASEGLKDKNGNFLFEANGTVDNFGHKQLGGLSIGLANLFQEKLGAKTRYYELSLLQRATEQNTSRIEKKIAQELSAFALNKAINGTTNKVAVIKRLNTEPYEYDFDLVDISTIANEERMLPEEYIDRENFTIKESFLEYGLPLIDGKDGLIDYFKIDK